MKVSNIVNSVKKMSTSVRSHTRGVKEGATLQISIYDGMPLGWEE